MRKLFKLLIMVGVLLCSSLVMSGCDKDIILVTGVDLYTNEIYIDINETVDLSYKVYPSNATNKKVTFWSTDENVASVDQNGKVTLKNDGEASIVVRSVDGGFEDYCKIATNVDPEAIVWDTSDKLTAVAGNSSYSAFGSMALNQVMKLKLDYIIDGVESDKVTNKKVKFTSSNTSNIEVINESEGIIKAVNNQIITGDKAYADITATVTTMDRTLSATCRIYINEYSSLDHLFVNYKNGNAPVLNERNGSETIYLTSGGASVDLYTYITNMSSVVKTDYDISIESSDPNKFSVEMSEDGENGLYGFKLTPSTSNEGPATLYIRTTCSDENGKTIRCSINVVVQAQIASVEASSTSRVDNGVEILQNGEIFGINLTYKKGDGLIIEGAERTIYFDSLDEIEVAGLTSKNGSGTAKLSEYIADYGRNQFKVIDVPESPTQKFKLTGYVYPENVEGGTPITFEYEFYLRNTLDGIIVTRTEKGDADPIPNKGISSVTIPEGGEIDLFAYATTYDFSKTEPAIVSVYVDDENMIGIQKDDFSNKVSVRGFAQGSGKITFVATDGLVEVVYVVDVYIVASVANIDLYKTQSNGILTDKIESDSVVVTGDTVTLYMELSATDGYAIECPTGCVVNVTNAVVEDEVVGVKVLKKITINMSGAITKTVTISVDRYLLSRTITITK